jgi:CRP-like cAMP-binding protein
MQRERDGALRLVDIFASLTVEQRAALARDTVTRKYGGGEAVVREGEPGDSMYVVTSGKVSVLVAPDRREVATIEKGGYFGEMSLLTGEPRTATVVANGEAVVLELTARQFRALGSESPQAVEQVGLAAATRRAELDRVRLVARGAASGDAPANFVVRMKKFLRLR